MTRGKCQACGRYADLETVELRTKGRTLYAGDFCRRCADDLTSAFKRTWLELGLRASA